MARNIVHVLDIGTSSIKALVAERRAGEENLRILGASLVPVTGMRKGAVLKPDELRAKIKDAALEAERTSGIPFRHAFVSFGSPALGFQKSRGRVAISRADGEITQYDIDRVTKQARPQSQALSNKEILATHSIGFTVDSELQTKDPLGIKGENLEGEIIFVTALRKPLEEIIEAVEKSGIAVDDIIVSPLASGRALLSARQREVGAVVLDMGADTTGVAVFEENIPYSVAIFPVGSWHVTNDIALGFQISLDEAEKIKLGGEMAENSVQVRKKFGSVVEARLEDMFELVEAHLKKVGRSGLLPGGIVLGGGGSRMPGMAEFAKNYLHIPSSFGRCLELEANHKISDPIWSVAVGMCLMATDDEKDSNFSVKKPSALKQRIFSLLKSLIP